MYYNFFTCVGDQFRFFFLEVGVELGGEREDMGHKPIVIVYHYICYSVSNS